MTTDSQTPNGTTQAPHHRRSREEVEALAKNFVATPTSEAPPSKKGSMAMIGGGVALALVVITVLAWPKAKVQRDTSAAEAAAAEAEQWKARLEAEKERKRKELEAGSDYLERIAASDAAMLKDLTDRADRLADRMAAMSRPAPADAPPTPRETTTTTAARQAQPTTTTAAKPAPTTATPTTTAATTQPKPAEQTASKPAPAAAAPTQVASAQAANCAIHVSELSSSGKLTYEDIKKMKGARTDEETGHVFTPPVQAAGGRTVVFEVMPDGCVSVKRR